LPGRAASGKPCRISPAARPGSVSVPAPESSRRACDRGRSAPSPLRLSGQGAYAPASVTVRKSRWLRPSHEIRRYAGISLVAPSPRWPLRCGCSARRRTTGRLGELGVFNDGRQGPSKSLKIPAVAGSRRSGASGSPVSKATARRYSGFQGFWPSTDYSPRAAVRTGGIGYTFDAGDPPIRAREGASVGEEVR
jgi:hypothetical protein